MSFRREVECLILNRRGGGCSELLRSGLDKLNEQELRSLFMLLRDMDQEIKQAERTFRPFPGGPKIRY